MCRPGIRRRAASLPRLRRARVACSEFARTPRPGHAIDDPTRKPHTVMYARGTALDLIHDCRLENVAVRV